MKLPQVAATYSLISDISYQVRDIYRVFDSVNLHLIIEYDRDELISAIIQKLELLEVTNHHDKIKRRKVIRKLEELSENPLADEKDIEKAINEILKAINELYKIQSVDISQIRLDLDKLLVIYEMKYITCVSGG